MVDNDTDLCCGCTLCEKICPVNAIEMKENCEGFLYPEINKEKCIGCNLCEKKCPIKNFTKKDEKYDFAYIAKHKDINTRINSRSGAVFVSISDWILKNNGVVYGCILNDENKAIHVKATCKEDRNLMCKSKYVQSYIGDIYFDIINELNTGKFVLFSGTPCQVDAILSFLKIKKVNIEKLISIDFVCHGCPSPKVFNDYINYLQEKYKCVVREYQFRDKEIMGWNGQIESFNDGRRKRLASDYTNLFHSSNILMRSCYKCPYSTVIRNSDLTIGDAWGIDKNNKDFNDNNGVSFFMIHSKKEKLLLDIIKNDCNVRKVKFDDFYQKNMKNPTSFDEPKRTEFWNYYYNNSFKKVINKYGMPKNKKAKMYIKMCLNSFTRRKNDK